ncbi:SusC/RagA family TonB-linked outer membrane protein [Sphingobacterium wenxiniae]|nr:TonB-dependent receptor [Sphingobacterium wenxiniae]
MMKRHVLTSMCIIACSAMQVVNAQQMSVAGKVTDSEGKPISGVTLTIKGTSQGTSTNESGLFTLNANSNATLIISAVGYQTQEIPLAGRNTLNIALKTDERGIDEVMVVAYGTATRASFTGSAATVSSQEIKDNPKPSFQEALIGKVPGLQVTTTSGQAGATPEIRIRGIGSMNASNSPLYVIDGVPVISGSVGQMSDYVSGSSNNVLATLNPNDIESVTVLKDAAASALYGSRAANGVIIVTTKQGKQGKPKIDLRSSISMTPSWATDNWEVAGPQEQINTLYRILHDSRTSSGQSDEAANQWVLNRFNNNFGRHGYEFSTNGPGLYENVNIKGRTDGIENRDGRYFDWDNALFRTGIFQTNDLSVSGATETTRYYTSLGYTQDKSRMIQNDYNRIGGRVNLTQKIGKYLEFGSNVSLAHQKTIGLNDTRNTGTNYLMQTRNLLWPFYWPTDYKTGDEYSARYGSLAYNPLYYNKEWENAAKSRKISAVESLTLRLLPELSIKTIFSYDDTETKDHLYYSAKHYTGQSTNGVVHEMSTNTMKMVSSTTANYNKTFQSHNIDALVGFEAEKNNTEFIRATGRNLPSSALHTVATAGELEASAYSWGNNMMSVLSRLQYNYNEKYYASASFRRDGSSRLGPENRWGNFWSIAGSWRLNNEAFLKEITAIDDLRIKASYGVNGTLPTSNFGWRAMTSYTNRYMEQAGGGLSNVADPSLTWETNYQTNIGVEFGLFANKLFGSVEYFNRDSKNLLQNVPISTITGFSSTLKNVGQINNKGWEFLIGSDIIKKNDWRWSASLNGTFLSSKVVKLYAAEGEEQGQDIIWNDPTGGDARTRFIYREGESTLAFFGIEWAGVDQTNGKNMWFVNNPDDPTDGDFLIDGRGVSLDYRKAQRVIMGDANPKMYGGINTDVEYKGISVGLNFIYKIGGKLYDASSRDVADDGYYWERIRSQYFIDETWTDIKESGSLPKVSGQDLEDVNQVSSRHLYDASFLRLRNISLAYRIPASFTKKAGINSARIYFNGANLLTFSKYKHADPEVNNYGTRGWETPMGKTYTFGLEFSF